MPAYKNSRHAFKTMGSEVVDLAISLDPWRRRNQGARRLRS